MHVSFYGGKNDKRTNQLICLSFSWRLKRNQERWLETLRAVAFTLHLGKRVGPLLDRFTCLLWSQPTVSLAPGTCSGEHSKNLLVLPFPEPARPPGWALPAAPFPGRAAGGSRAGGSWERGDMPKAAPKRGRHSSSLGQGMDQAPLCGYWHHRHLLPLPPAAGDPPARRPEPTAVGAVPLFPTQRNQKAFATLKSLKSNHLEGKLWLGYVSGYHDQSQALGCDKITCCENKVITRLGYS